SQMTVSRDTPATLFPYPTLFRSLGRLLRRLPGGEPLMPALDTDRVHVLGVRHHGPGSARAVRAELERLRPDAVLIEGPPEADARSEEHTSELQSRENLVCRLLLE